MELRLPISAITDEFAPDPAIAARAMAEAGLAGAELRVLWGKNVLDVDDEGIERVHALLQTHGLKAVSIASPLLKCVLPGSEPLDSRFERDVFGSAHTYEDQPRLLRRACRIARRVGAPVIRVFSFWRALNPAACFGRVAEALRSFAAEAAGEGLVLGLENEHTCNAGTGAEAAALVRAVDHPGLKVVWDPANACVAGENGFPEGYRALRAGDIAHVHAKDCRLEDGQPHWMPLGTGALDWKGQFAALVRDGYRGWVSLETHWPGPGGDKLQGSAICAWNLRGLLTW
ncbi:MAG: sugar phosphate isomerase/epimerase [Bryobacterales bacterium]|nr:sugar phosphate isomerase/epimerase [Bryobacterales bacterium]